MAKKKNDLTGIFDGLPDSLSDALRKKATKFFPSLFKAVTKKVIMQHIWVIILSLAGVAMIGVAFSEWLITLGLQPFASFGISGIALLFLAWVVWKS